jgi:transcription initiation factor IIF auxiliary subunit
MLYRNAVLFILILFSSVSVAQKIVKSNTSSLSKTQIAIDNTSSLSGKSGYYNWTVFVQADDVTLNNIDHVEYLLHPTFSNPQVSSNNRSTNFSYTSTGWGEFEIKVKIVFKNRQPPQYISYWLRLQSKIPKAAIKSVKTVYKR